MRDMNGMNPAATMLRKLMRHIRVGLMYVGSSAWTRPEIQAALRAARDGEAGPGDREAHRPGDPPPEPDTVTPLSELPHNERRLFLELEEQIRRENDR
ncbi:hypothetical protein [Spirillospora sp. CA-294931]|uniref:hypothetical protein n=1 Tax=Spirillospora sp. CA-294931 TaxID=3240042 RepID=UPI003D94FCE8